MKSCSLSCIVRFQLNSTVRPSYETLASRIKPVGGINQLGQARLASGQVDHIQSAARLLAFHVIRVDVRRIEWPALDNDQRVKPSWPEDRLRAKAELSGKLD